MFEPHPTLAGTAREKVTQFGVLTGLSVAATVVTTEKGLALGTEDTERSEDEITAYASEVTAILRGRRGSSSEDVIYRHRQRTAAAWCN